MRSYGEYCAIAKSLDVVGDRWTLLIVRELSLQGGCRYTDLRNGLPGIATNLLAERLRELEDKGVVTREEAPPPIATTLFRLTPRGEELKPVLDGLTRWGLPFMTEPTTDEAVRSHWLAGAIEMLLEDRKPKEAPASIELQIGDQPIVLNLAGRVDVTLGPGADPDLTITGSPTPVLGLLLGLLRRGDAKKRGVTVSGDAALLDRIGGEPMPVAVSG
jgi:DNA-binding HxlR family transcriptional regulator